jgi:hypothetical protein
LSECKADRLTVVLGLSMTPKGGVTCYLALGGRHHVFWWHAVSIRHTCYDISIKEPWSSFNIKARVCPLSIYHSTTDTYSSLSKHNLLLSFQNQSEPSNIMSAVVDAIGVVSGVLGIIGFFQSNFPEGKPEGATVNIKGKIVEWQLFHRTGMSLTHISHS